MLKIFKFKNLDYNSSPSILHSADGFVPFFNTIPKIYFYKNLNQNCRVITVTNIKEEGCLEKSINVLQPFEKIKLKTDDWQYHLKIVLINDYIKNIKEKYTIFCDSHDVIILNLKKIENCFSFYDNCKMLFNGEFAFWPDENDLLKNNILNEEIPRCFKKEFEEKINKNKRATMYLNSGVWIARTSFLKEVFDFMMKQKLFHYKFLDNKGMIRTQDQHIYREALMHFYPEIQIDYKNVFCQTLKRKNKFYNFFETKNCEFAWTC